MGLPLPAEPPESCGLGAIAGLGPNGGFGLSGGLPAGGLCWVASLSFELNKAAMLPVERALMERFNAGASSLPVGAGRDTTSTSPVGDSTRTSGGGEALEKLDENRPERGDGGGEIEEDSERLLR